MPATSEPAPGSVTPTAVMVLPAITPGRYFSSWRLVPKRTRCGLAMSVCTSTVMAKPPWVERPTSSASTTEARASRPAPPSASGTRSEKKPSSPIWRSTSRGTKPASSHLGPSGFTFSSTKRRSWLRMRSWSSVKIGCHGAMPTTHPSPARQAEHARASPLLGGQALRETLASQGGTPANFLHFPQFLLGSFTRVDCCRIGPVGRRRD